MKVREKMIICLLHIHTTGECNCICQVLNFLDFIWGDLLVKCDERREVLNEGQRKMIICLLFTPSVNARHFHFLFHGEKMMISLLYTAGE